LGEGAVKGVLGCLVVLVLLVVGGTLLAPLSSLWTVVFPLWICLYPLSSLGTTASAIATYMVVQRTTPAPGPLNLTALAWAFAAALAVLVVTSRLEHRLARRTTYRVFRHVLRLGLFGATASTLLLRYTGEAPVVPDRLPDLAQLWRALNSPVEIGMVLGVIVVMHFLLWTDNGIRRAWHGLLEVLRLRPTGL
jgi:hypothetical protein